MKNFKLYEDMNDKEKIEQLQYWLAACRQREEWMRLDMDKDKVLKRLQEININLHCRAKRGTWDTPLNDEDGDPPVIQDLLRNLDIMIGHIFRRVKSGHYEIPERTYEDEL